MKYLTLILAFSTICSFAKETPRFPISALTEVLKKDVAAIYRLDEMTFRIHTKSKATLYVHKAITILNSNGKREAQEVVGYDKLSKVNFLKGTVYNQNGELVKKLKASEIYDQSAFDGFSLYSDNRLKAADLTQGTYPYTVEFEYEIEFKYLFQIPTYNLPIGEKTSLEEGTFKLIYPIELKPRYDVVNIDSKPMIENPESGIESLTWNFKNVLPIKLEPLGPLSQDILPHIDAAPTQFSYEGYDGKMEDWNQFGRWIHSLNKDRNLLPESTKEKLRQLTKGLSTPEQKIRVVYEYLQSRTRYVSVQLGIGGFQPFEASVVDQTGYGDCKALSNYMVSMLEVVDVKANYVLIMAGENAPSLNSDFTRSQFNHAVVCVPLATDTVWLECTSQTNPYGYMGSFTGNRRALAITDEGARIVNTPVYNESVNIQKRTADVAISLTGDARARVVTTYSGLQYENGNLQSILSDQYDKQKIWVENNTDVPSFDIKSFSIKNEKEMIPSAVVTLDLVLNKIASVSGKRLFITPNLMNRSTFIPERVENRKTNVYRRMGYTDFDTVLYKIPESMYPEFLPKSIHIETQFGTYDAGFSVDEKGLLYTRKMVMKRGEYPASSYVDLIEFYKNVNKADQTKIVFLTKT
jgi:transglutaminase-like putative cysteine protease